jgi:outer membrane protein OmpA-like peptidoglycan-associated protein
MRKPGKRSRNATRTTVWLMIALAGSLAAGCWRAATDTGEGEQASSTAATPVTAAPVPAVLAAPPVAAAIPPPPPPVLSFEEAVSNAAHAVFKNAPAPTAGDSSVVIDPLVDGVTGYQSKATKSIQDRILGYVKSDFPQYAVHSITTDSLRTQPRVLIGTFTPVNSQMKTTGAREAYRFCLVMADLKQGKIVAKSVARVRIDDADSTPSPMFRDSPVWTDDPSIQAYVSTCQASKVGDPIRPEYYDGLFAAALVSEALNAYEEGHYAEALDLFRTARKSPAGDQLRVYSGIYQSLAMLGRTEESAGAFRDLVDYGIQKKRLAVKFLFRPGSVRLTADSNTNNYALWLQQIAAQSVSNNVCLQITGHTSPTGPAAMNESLSLLRAEYIQSRLESDQPKLKKRTVAAGAGSRENMIGTGKDDGSDALDRRVELKPIEPCA